MSFSSTLFLIVSLYVPFLFIFIFYLTFWFFIYCCMNTGTGYGSGSLKSILLQSLNYHSVSHYKTPVGHKTVCDTHHTRPLPLLLNFPSYFSLMFRVLFSLLMWFLFCMVPTRISFCLPRPQPLLVQPSLLFSPMFRVLLLLLVRVILLISFLVMHVKTR